MTKMVYAWREGRSASPYLSNVTPQVVGEELEKVREQGGGMIFPRAVIDHARPSDSPLHSCFEWNDTEAAEKFRIVQARGVIKSVEIVEIKGGLFSHCLGNYSSYFVATPLLVFLRKKE